MKATASGYRLSYLPLIIINRAVNMSFFLELRLTYSVSGTEISPAGKPEPHIRT